MEERRVMAMLHKLENELLTGIRILELAEGPSGGYAGRMLAMSGAQVTKLSMKSQVISSFRDTEKKVLQAKDFRDREIILNRLLCESWDIILWDSHGCNTLDQRLTTFLSDSEFRSIVVRIDFPKGIENDEEHGLQALGGWMDLTGEPSGPPLAIGGYPASYLVGAHAATAGLLAFLEKTWTGRERLVKVQALSIAVSALEGVYSNYISTGVSRSKSGNRHHSLSPMAILPAANGWVFVGAPVDEKWELLENWAGLSHRAEWSDAKVRMADCDGLENSLAKWTCTMTQEELFVTGQTFRMPFAKVQTLEDVKNCTQLAARQFWSDSKKINLPWKINSNHTQMKGEGGNSIKKSSWKDIRILDLTGMWSGPYCTRLFADLGVEVIKIEAPHRPDGIRSNKGASSPFFRELNRNKTGIQLDLRLESDYRTFLDLVTTSDILIENFSPRVMTNFGLTREKLWKYKPDLAIVSLSAFGQTGPYRDFVGYGPTLESMSGLASITSYPNKIPFLPGFSLTDMGAGIHGAFALVTSLIRKENECTGMQIDLSQYEVACQFTADYLIDGDIPAQQKNPVSVKSMIDIVNSGQIIPFSLPGGDPVLGLPWESIGWEAPKCPPPEFNSHASEVYGHLIK
ncbi:CoA transferase [Peribacillus sp. NPDC097675]|uniref:CoA transferase n=1 Tax=Peribacillus sp. NPDC097675 TaxID=3390618 RepID=UPI003D0197A4